MAIGLLIDVNRFTIGFELQWGQAFFIHLPIVSLVFSTLEFEADHLEE